VKKSDHGRLGPNGNKHEQLSYQKRGHHPTNKKKIRPEKKKRKKKGGGGKTKEHEQGKLPAGTCPIYAAWKRHWSPLKNIKSVTVSVCEEKRLVHGR